MNPATVEITHGSNNVFADLGFAPAEAENLKIRADLNVGAERTDSDRRRADKRNGSIEILTMSYRDR